MFSYKVVRSQGKEEECKKMREYEDRWRSEVKAVKGKMSLVDIIADFSTTLFV